MSTRVLLYFNATFFAAFWCVAVDPHITKGSEIVNKIVHDWQRRQQLGSFRYLMAGTHRTAKGSLNSARPPSVVGDLPPEDVVNDVKIEYFVDLERNRSRIEREFESYLLDEVRFERRFTVELFDGQHAPQIFYPRDRNQEYFGDATEGPWNADLEIESSSGPAFGRHDLAVLLAHGMVPEPNNGSTLSATGTLRRTLAPEMFADYGRGVRDGQECAVLRSQVVRTGPNPTFREFWVDVENDSTIIRYVRYIGDSEEFQIDMWYAEGDSRGYPLAHFTYMERVSEELVQTREMHVVEYEPKPVLADSLFYMKPQPGFNVYDWTTKRQYRVGLSGEPDRDLGELRRGMAGKPMNWRRFLFFVLNVAMLLVGGAWYVFHYRKRRRS